MIVFVLCVVGLSVCGADALGYYRVVGPRAVRPNSIYHVAVSAYAAPVPTQVRVELVGRLHGGGAYTVDQTLVVEPYSTRIAKLEIGDISKGDYRLMVSGTGGISFETSSSLVFLEKSYSVFIQTDKSVYKPGNKLMFRALVLNSSLKPAAEVRNEQLRIEITDGKRNTVKQWKNVTAPRGVYTSELQLSKSPVLGDWSIHVTIHGQTFNKTVQVAEYVLPKFLIDIQTKRHVLFSEGVVTATVQSRYDYGKKVKGDMTVSMYPTIHSGVIQPIFQNPIRKVVKLNGTAAVTFDIAKDLRLNDEYERAVIVDVIAEEADTGRRQNNSVVIYLHKYEHRMELIQTADYYKPGLKYTAFIKVSNHDGSPIKEDKRKVTVRHGFSKTNEINEELTYQLNKNGITELVFYPPADATNNTALRIEAEYMDLKEWFSPIPAAVSSSGNYLLAELRTDRPTVNQEVEILVNCTEPLRYISYELLGRGDVILASTLSVRDQKQFNFHFTASHAMVPTAHLVVNYMRKDGELVADSLDIEIDGLLQNYIDVQLNSAETRPDADIDVTIHAQPNSYVGILAVDQNAALLRSGHDLSQDHVADDLRSYDIGQYSPYSSIFADKKRHFVWKSGSANAKDIFYDSGALLLTNGLVNNYRPTLGDLRPLQYGSSTVKPDRGPSLSFQTVTRPPLAGPYAFSRIPRPVWNVPKVYLSDDIQPTWLFANFSSGYEGKTSIRKRVPGTLSTWVLTGFSVDPLYGLGLVSSARKLKVSKPFHVNLDLPFSVQRGEVLAIPVVFYNNQDKEVVAELTLHNLENRFQFAISPTTKDNVTKIELFRKKSLTIRRNSAASTSFIIKPTLIGPSDIKITAIADSRTETATKTLNVKAEGDPESYTRNIMVDLRKTSTQNSNLTIDLPKNAVPNSENIQVSVTGDLLASVVNNLDGLSRSADGSGEQNLVNFIPSVVVLDYLGRDVPQTVKSQAITNLESGYQRQLTFRKPDGSFGAFARTETNGSVWLTACVSRAFNDARKYIYVDDDVVLDALQWLSEGQAANGSFPETGTIIHQKMQSPNASSVALTAYVAVAFHENKHRSPPFGAIAQRALDYVSRNLDESLDVYSTAVAAYALHLLDHPFKRTALNVLEGKARTNASCKWWAQDVPTDESRNPWHMRPKSLDTETTAYALLAYVHAGLLEDATPVLRWLLQQSDRHGAFASSQDTAVALRAVAQLARKLSPYTDMRVRFMYRKQESTSVSLNADNNMILHSYQISPTARQMNVTAEGGGLAVVRVSYKYNMNVTGPWPMFTLDPQVDKNSHKHHLQLSVCMAFVGRNSSSNLAVMEVHLPSGFTADPDSLPSLEVSQNVRLVETRDAGTVVVLYMGNVTRDEHCPTVRAFRTHRVAEQKPVAVVIYDHYDTSRRARVFYRGPSSTLCDICEREDCQDACVLEPETQVAADTDARGSATSSAGPRCWTLLALCIYFIKTN